MTETPRRANATSGLLVAAVAGVLAITASACSADRGDPPHAAAAPEAGVTAAAVDSAELTREEAAARYLEIVAASNSAMDKCMPVLNRIWDANEASLADLRKVRAACEDMPKANRQFADDLTSTTWPAEARNAAGQLADELRADQLAWQEIADASTEDDILDPTYPLTEDGPGADLIRAHLGLPAREDIAEEG